MERQELNSSTRSSRKEEGVIKQQVHRAAFLTYATPYTLSCVTGKSRDRLQSRCGNVSAGRLSSFSRCSFLGQGADSSQGFNAYKLSSKEGRKEKPSATRIQMVETAAKPVTQTGNRLADLCINSIRFLAIDAVENAKSGHPGMPMGMAPAAYVVFEK